MKTFLLATALAFSLVGVALAGEGAGNPFPSATPGVTIVNPPASFDVGSAAYPDLPRAYAFAPAGEDVIDPQGNEGIVQTANSLPRGALDGTVAYAQQQSVQRYFAQQAVRRGYAALRGAARVN